MPRGNKKTKKTVKAVKASPAKKVVRKSAAKPKGKVRKTGQPKKENILGSVKSKPAVLGVRIPVTQIPVREIKPAPQADFGDFVFEFEDDDQEEIIDKQTDNIVQSAVRPQVQEKSEAIEEAETEPEYYDKKDFSQTQKKIIMYVSMAGIMGVLVVFWGLSIKNSFSQGMQKSLTDDSSIQLINQFADTFNDFQNGLANVPNQVVSDNINVQVLGKVKEELLKDDVKTDIASQLKEKLENLNTDSLNANLNN